MFMQFKKGTSEFPKKKAIQYFIYWQNRGKKVGNLHKRQNIFMLFTLIVLASCSSQGIKTAIVNEVKTVEIIKDVETESPHTVELNLASEKVQMDVTGPVDPSTLIPIDTSSVTEEINGYMDPSGNIRINNPDIRFPKPFSEGLAQAYHIGKKHGYIDQTGEFVIDPIYRRTYPFSEGLAKVCLEEFKKCGFIDKTGSYVIEPKYDDLYLGDAFFDGYVTIYYGVDADNNYLGANFMDKNGNYMFNQGFLREAADYSEGLAHVSTFESRGFNYGYIDTTGNFIINDVSINANPFHEGLAAVEVATNRSNYCRNIINSHNSAYGYMDRTGILVIPANYWFAGNFTNSLALVDDCDSDDCFYIDREGNNAFPNITFDCNLSTSFENGYASVYIEIDEGLSFNIIDANGNLLLPESKFLYSSGNKPLPKSTYLVDGIEKYFYAGVVQIKSTDPETNISTIQWINLETGEVIREEVP